MKKLTLTLCALTALISAAYAGTESYSSKDSKSVSAPAACPTWYADNEFNLGISGIYAPTTNAYREDRYLGVDHGWGGAIDAKYFFRRYFGVGIQGFGLGLDANNSRTATQRVRNESNDFVAGALGTFTLRYPIPCTRFAPYGWAGIGGIFNGGVDDRFTNNFRRGDNNQSRLMGQYGAGFEVRFTPHVGLTNDVSYNQLDGSHNDFVQVRTGLNFAF
ncbi:MAG: porin family protein [Verrucomicrobiota bacterium]|nr:porin family protein [Verrucomicrobiota bacterium]